MDYLNVYPTLTSLAGLPRPEHLEGFDMTPILENPAADWDVGDKGSEGSGKKKKKKDAEE